MAGHKYESVQGKVSGAKIWESIKQNLLGTQIDKRLSSDVHGLFL